MKDLISREAVLNTLENMDKVLDENRTVEAYKDLLGECFKELPPVEPQEHTDEKYEELMKQYKHLRKYASDLETKLSAEQTEWISVKEAYTKGEWLFEPTQNINNPWKCSCCGHRAGRYKYKTYKFCPWCGAKMNKGE